MSSKLLKGVYTSLQNEDKRVIDTNELVKRRIEELTVKMQQSANRGFVSGLNAPKMEIPMELFQDTENDGVIKNEVLEDDSAEEILNASRAEADKIIEDAQMAASEIIENAKAEANRLMAEAQRQIESDKISTLNMASEQGYKEGIDKAQAELARKNAEYQKRREDLEYEYQQMIDELEPQFIETITNIYEHIFHVELKSYKEILAYLISMTMRKVEGDRNFIVHVSKEDYPYVSMQKKQIAAGATAANDSLDIIEDLTLGKNECFIETNGGIFDCGLGTQLTELTQRLMVLSYEK